MYWIIIIIIIVYYGYNFVYVYVNNSLLFSCKLKLINNLIEKEKK